MNTPRNSRCRVARRNRQSYRIFATATIFPRLVTHFERLKGSALCRMPEFHSRPKLVEVLAQEGRLRDSRETGLDLYVNDVVLSTFRPSSVDTVTKIRFLFPCFVTLSYSISPLASSADLAYPCLISRYLTVTLRS